jgi:hypothetical protein
MAHHQRLPQAIFWYCCGVLQLVPLWHGELAAVVPMEDALNSIRG